MSELPRPEPGPIVCIGASWGGVLALGVVLSGLPADLAAPVCIVQHRSEDDDLHQLVPYLSRATQLTVCEPDDREPLRAGTVYLAPAGYHLLVEDGHVALSVEDRVRWSRPSIDVLFQSAAESNGPGTTAVVLTGANDDGARGARAVHEVGGVVLVQDPSGAERTEMPNATIATGIAAAILPLEDIADAVARRVGEDGTT